MAKNIAVPSRAYHHGDLRRALIDAAMAIVTEEQNWDFSLREVARRAGVSHNAPYNHFPEKLHILDAIAAAGFESLEQGMRSAMADAYDARVALFAIARAYIAFATSNPALYRLMFGPEFARPGSHAVSAEAAGARAKVVLEEAIVRGIGERCLNVQQDEVSIAVAILSCWSMVHGLAMLIVDKSANHRPGAEDVVGGVMGHFLDGLCRREVDGDIA